MRKQLFGAYPVSVIGFGTAEFGGRHPESLARELMDAMSQSGATLSTPPGFTGTLLRPGTGKAKRLWAGGWRTGGTGTGFS